MDSSVEQAVHPAEFGTQTCAALFARLLLGEALAESAAAGEHSHFSSRIAQSLRSEEGCGDAL
jgi:hypothetical protein